MTEQQVDCDYTTDMYITFDICKGKLTRKDNVQLITGTVKYWRLAVISRDDEFATVADNGSVYAIYKTENGESYCVEGEVTGISTHNNWLDFWYVPAKVLEGDFFHLTIFAIDGTTRLTTTEATVHLERSGFTTNLQAYDPDLDNGDIFSQLRELINNCLVDVRVEGNQLLFIKEDTVYYRFTITNHQHTSNQITDLEDTIGLEIKRGYQVLVNKIRTYGE